MLNPIIFDRIRSQANGIYVAPRTRIITTQDRIVRPEQLRVARRLIRDYNTRGYDLRKTIERAHNVDRGEVQYIAPYKPNASIHIDSFHDYEPCILARYLRRRSRPGPRSCHRSIWKRTAWRTCCRSSTVCRRCIRRMCRGTPSSGNLSAAAALPIKAPERIGRCVGCKCMACKGFSAEFTGAGRTSARKFCGFQSEYMRQSDSGVAVLLKNTDGEIEKIWPSCHLYIITLPW